VGNYRDPAADRQNERGRSASLAQPDPPAHRQWLALLTDRKAHAVELQRLNGLSFSLTVKRAICDIFFGGLQRGGRI